jgi:hypothetical protein
MNFCPNCSNILDYVKKINEPINYISIKKLVDLFKLIDSNEDLSNYKADFDKVELLENKKYIKLSDNIKKNIDILFTDRNSLNTETKYKCINCGYTKLINDTIRIYYNNLDSNNYIFDKTNDEYKLICYDPLNPHTKDYICKNEKCVTHTQKELKNAVFYKNKNEYNINYICCICYTKW